MTTHALFAKENFSISDSVKVDIIRAIELSSEIPQDAKPAIKDFLEELWGQSVSESISNLPQEVVDNYEAILEVLQKFVL